MSYFQVLNEGSSVKMSYCQLLNEGCQKFAVHSKNDFLIFQRAGWGDSNACKTFSNASGNVLKQYSSRASQIHYAKNFRKNPCQAEKTCVKMSYFQLVTEGCQKLAVHSKNDFLIFQRAGWGDSNACKTFSNASGNYLKQYSSRANQIHYAKCF